MAANFVYMAAGNKAEAQKIAKSLVEHRLAACVNILENMKSVYRWENDIQEDTEDYMKHEHFEDIRLPDRDTPPMIFDQEDSLELHHILETETIHDYIGSEYN